MHNRLGIDVNTATWVNVCVASQRHRNYRSLTRWITPSRPVIR